MRAASHGKTGATISGRRAGGLQGYVRADNGQEGPAIDRIGKETAAGKWSSTCFHCEKKEYDGCSVKPFSIGAPSDASGAVQ